MVACPRAGASFIRTSDSRRQGPAARLARSTPATVALMLLGLLAAAAATTGGAAAFAASAAATRGCLLRGPLAAAAGGPRRAAAAGAGRLARRAEDSGRVASLEKDLAAAVEKATKQAAEATKAAAGAKEAEARAQQLMEVLRSLGQATGEALLAAGVIDDPLTARDAALAKAEESRQQAAEAGRLREEAMVKLELLEVQIGTLTQRALAAEQESERRGAELAKLEERAQLLSSGVKALAKAVGVGGGFMALFQAPSEEQMLKDTLEKIEQMKVAR